jgi:branched-chain amino acid transport system substrate-binding protein
MSRALSRADRHAATAALIAAVTITLAGCTGLPMPTPTPTASPTPTGDGILRIGTLFPGSGPLARFSPAQVAGVNAAVREIDAAGGVLGAPVEVVNRNAGADDDGMAGPSFDDLVARGVDVVIGPSSSATAEQILPAAALASVPLISPSATGVRLTDDAGWFFRTIPTDADLGAALAGLLVGQGASKVVLVEVGGQPGSVASEALAAGLEAQDAELVAEVPGDGDPAAVISQVGAAAPDAVVLAAPDGGEVTAALIAALEAGDFGGEALWLVGPAAVGYGDALPAGTLASVTGVAAGFSPDDAFRTRVRLEDPGAGNLRYAAEAYDATILAALAATLAGDDGGASIDRIVPAAAAGGIPCHSYGECLDVLRTQDDIDYQGVTGSLDLDENGDLSYPGFAVYGYTPENAVQFAEWAAR